MKERMLRGELYIADDPALAADHKRAQDLLERYNATRFDEHAARDLLLRELLAEVGDGVIVKTRSSAPAPSSYATSRPASSRSETRPASCARPGSRIGWTCRGL